MLAVDDMTDPSVSSSSFNSIEFGRDVTMHSPEDVTWADSCLTKDPEALENGWNSLRDALLETVISLPDSPVHETDNVPESDKLEIFSSSEGTGDMQNIDKATIDIASKTSEPSNSNSSSGENTDGFWSRHKLEDVFLPTYNENLRDIGTSDPEVDTVLQTLKLDQSTDDIFKIWDLDIPAEEDDLIKQLHESLAESSSGPNASVSDELKTWKSLEDAPLDDLISGINDLSLSPYSS